MKIRSCFWLGFYCLLQHAFVQAQSVADTTTEDDKDNLILRDVVVTGQYRPIKAGEAIHRVRVIDNKKIEAMGAQNLRDVLLNEMNVTIAQDNVLGSSVSIQGVSGQNVKVLIDGVPVIGRQNGNIDISQLNVYNVERIELVEGPMSVTYGTDALAGTINIITKSAVKNKLDASVNTYTETIGKYNINAQLGFKHKQHAILWSGARNFFDGWDPQNETPFLSFKPQPADQRRALQWDAKEEYNSNFQYIYAFRKWRFRFKSDYFYDVITNRGLPRGFYQYNAFDDYYHTYRFNNTFFTDAEVFRNKRFNLIVALNHYRRVKNTYEIDLTTLNDIPAAPSDQDTSAYLLFNSRATLSSGTHKKINYELGYDINWDRGSGVRIAGRTQAIGDYALYSSIEYKVVKDLQLRAGLRYAYNTVFATPLIPSLNIKYKLNQLTLRASLAKGFRSPNIKELYFEFKDSNHDIVGNPNLQSESSDNYNVSLSYQSKEKKGINYSVEVSGFYNNMYNMINLAQLDTSAMQFTYINIDRFKAQGLQANTNLSYKRFTVNLGASYIGRYNQLHEQDYSAVKTFSYTPEFRANFTYMIPGADIQFAFFGKYTGAMQAYGLDASNNVLLTTVDPYMMADCSFSRKFFKETLQLSVGCKNLFNTTNINRIGAAAVSGTAHSTTSSNVSISTGRSFFIGAGYQFHR